jgi:hypothetical protein
MDLKAAMLEGRIASRSQVYERSQAQVPEPMTALHFPAGTLLTVHHVDQKIRLPIRVQTHL